MTKPPYQIDSSLRKNYPAHHPQESGMGDEVIPISRGGTGATTVQGARDNLGVNDASNLTTGTLPNDRVSNSLPRNKAYRQGNILGTVAQSGGAPTGAIIERGSNANGEYVRFADGTQICWRQWESTGVTPTSRSEGVLTGGAYYNRFWTYPISFSSAPFTASNKVLVRTDSSVRVFSGSSIISSSAVSAQERFWAAAAPFNFINSLLMAIGRWY